MERCEFELAQAFVFLELISLYAIVWLYRTSKHYCIVSMLCFMCLWMLYRRQDLDTQAKRTGTEVISSPAVRRDKRFPLGATWVMQRKLQETVNHRCKANRISQRLYIYIRLHQPNLSIVLSFTFVVDLRARSHKDT